MGSNDRRQIRPLPGVCNPPKPMIGGSAPLTGQSTQPVKVRRKEVAVPVVRKTSIRPDLLGRPPSQVPDLVVSHCSAECLQGPEIGGWCRLAHPCSTRCPSVCFWQR